MDVVRYEAPSGLPVHPSDHACIDFINSRFTDHLGDRDATDRIRSAEWQAWFLARHHLELAHGSAPPVAQLVQLREELGRVLDRWARGRRLDRRDVTTLDSRISGVSLRLRVMSEDGNVSLELEPLRRDWAWVMAMVTKSAVDLLSTGEPERLKRCDNPECSWLFYDSTVNRSKRYCSTTPCGSLMRVRRFRQRT